MPTPKQRNKPSRSQVPVVIFGIVAIISASFVVVTTEKEKDLTAFMLIISGAVGGVLGVLRGDTDEIVEQWIDDRRNPSNYTANNYSEYQYPQQLPTTNYQDLLAQKAQLETQLQDIDRQL